MIVFFLSCKVNRFYIKPQQRKLFPAILGVVKLIDSTSNHNQQFFLGFVRRVVKLIDSTSNHNAGSFLGSGVDVVKLIDSTSNHNQ